MNAYEHKHTGEAVDNVQCLADVMHYSGIGIKTMKIEEGCLAVIVNSLVPANIGKCVKVLKFIGKLGDYVGADRWLVDGDIVDTCGDIVNHQRESYLMRIDGIKETNTERQTATA